MRILVESLVLNPNFKELLQRLLRTTCSLEALMKRYHGSSQQCSIRDADKKGKFSQSPFYRWRLVGFYIFKGVSEK
jgi:hypothetical protein